MKREQFTFYRSYYEAIKVLPQKEQIKVLLSLCAYALDETEPSLSGVALSVFTLMRPTVDKGRKKAENRFNKETSNAEENENKCETNEKETKDKSKSNAEENDTEGEKEREEEKEKEREYSPFVPPLSGVETNKKQAEHDRLTAELLAGCGEELITTVEDWLKYKREKRQSYGATGMKTLLGKIRRFTDSYGEQAVIGVIRDSMSNSYQGIVWDRLEKGGGNGNNTAGKAGLSASYGQYTRGAIRYD